MIIKKLDPFERYEIEMLNGKKVEFVITESTPEYLRFESRDCIGKGFNLKDVEPWLEAQYKMIPDVLRVMILDTERVHYVKYGKNPEIIKKTVKLFLPAASEIFSEYECKADQGLYKQLDYYKDIHNRLRKATGLSKNQIRSGYYLTSSACPGFHNTLVGVSCTGDYTRYSYKDNDYADAPICFRIKRNVQFNLDKMIHEETREENDT